MGTTSLSAGELLRRKRVQRGLSARALSLAAGQSSSYVTKLESGSIEPSLKAFARLASVLGLSAAEVHLAVSCEATSDYRTGDQ